MSSMYIKKGSTDKSVYLRIIDATTGLPSTSYAYNSSGIDLWYRREGAAHTSITEVTQTASGAHSDGGFVHIRDGVYRLDLPDAAVASGVTHVVVCGTITGAVIIPCYIQLGDFDIDSANVTVGSIANNAITAASINADAITAAKVASDVSTEIAAAVWAYVIENSKSALALMRLMYAALCNKVSGGGTSSVAFRDDADSKDRIVATVDSDGNRSAVSKDAT